MRSLATDSALAIVTVTTVLVLIIGHEFLAAVAGETNRFVMTRRWLSWAFTVLLVLLAVLIIARFYYLRAA
jgi:threonine/homoserine/homoserine lactone efflux protein